MFDRILNTIEANRQTIPTLPNVTFLTPKTKFRTDPNPLKNAKNIRLNTTLWGFLHLKSELIREAENQKTDKNHRKTVKYGSIFEGEIT